MFSVAGGTRGFRVLLMAGGTLDSITVSTSLFCDLCGNIAMAGGTLSRWWHFFQMDLQRSMSIMTEAAIFRRHLLIMPLVATET